MDWGNALAVILILYLIGYIAYTSLGWGSATTRLVAAKLSSIPLNIGTAALAIRAASRANTDPRIRRALLAFGVTYLLIFVCNLLQFYVGFIQDGDAFSSPVHFVAFAAYLVWTMAFLSMPLARRVEGEFWKFLLDIALIMVGTGLAIWYFVLRPSALQAPNQPTLTTVINLGYPLLKVVLLYGVFTVILRRPADSRRSTPVLLISGTLVYLAFDLANDFITVDLSYYATTQMVMDNLYLASYGLIIWAFRQYYTRETVATAGQAEESPRSQPVSPVPYAAVALAYGLLLWLALREWPRPLSVLTIGTALIALLLVVRQVMAVRENVRLLDERSARETERRLSVLVQRSSDVIAILDLHGVVRFVSPSVTRIFGYLPTEMDGVRLEDLVHPDDQVHAQGVLAEAMRPHGAPAPTEWRFQHRDGSWRHVEAVLTNLLDEPAVRGIVINTRDISERKALQAQLTHQAFHDQLTGLANRSLFLDRVTHALTLARRHQKPLAVIFLDLDNFKTVNDSLGHSVGDRLLTIAAQRLLASVRTADTVARLGGNEFAVLLEEMRMRTARRRRS